MDDEHRRETRERSVSIPVDFERELMEQYPSAARPSEAAKLAMQEAVEARKADLTPQDVYDSVRQALEAVAAEGSSVIVTDAEGDLHVEEPDEAMVIEDPEEVVVDPVDPEED
jgi:hypothetical protein